MKLEVRVKMRERIINNNNKNARKDIGVQKKTDW